MTGFFKQNLKYGNFSGTDLYFSELVSGLRQGQPYSETHSLNAAAI